MNFDPAIILNKKDNFVENEVDGEIVIVPLEDDIVKVGSLFHLNETGSFIWNNIDGVNSLEDIKNLMLSSFDINAENVIKDIENFIEEVRMFVEFKN